MKCYKHYFGPFRGAIYTERFSNPVAISVDVLRLSVVIALLKRTEEIDRLSDTMGQMRH